MNAGTVTEGMAVAKHGKRQGDEAIWAAGAAGVRPDWADVMWFGADAHGRVGMFTSAGPGPIPRAVFRDLAAYNALDRFLRELPTAGKAEVLIRYKWTGDWVRVAERGLFAFNYDYDRGRPNGYRLVARPAVPLSLGQLPGWVNAELSEAVLHGESFAEAADRVADLSGVPGGLVG
ncbi:hypothetical protein PX52LOC_04675 [Limnoglobus roseus]|uniref:Uncharacterized protein n=1 Tax=Limnoglobus roseus TaxID=2598579 RepID=A0A5C1AHM7_9BACT|nr:hypothetical protein PX52LOC_04675 [Limnoglobus roseus]